MQNLRNQTCWKFWRHCSAGTTAKAAFISSSQDSDMKDKVLLIQEIDNNYLWSFWSMKIGVVSHEALLS